MTNGVPYIEHVATGKRHVLVYPSFLYSILFLSLPNNILF